ncbi:HHE domain-containing protein [Paraphysoderma sedebokerense]|nr:HHE domain-containing protein [Paraphysoderma sedebokerense]
MNRLHLLVKPSSFLPRYQIPKRSFHSTILTMQALSTTQKPIDQLIVNDHNSFRDLFSRYRSHTGSLEERQMIVNEIIREVAIHSVAEEVILYPAFESANLDGNVVADHLRKEHQIVKEDLYKLDSMKVGDPGYDEHLQKIMNELEHHMKEEEEQDLRELRARVGEDELIRLGQKFDGTKKIVPTRPHPSAPDRPPLETLAGILTAPIDKMRDMARSFADRRVEE